eukprot:1467969-Prymnesium_polylepis.1
MAWPLWWTHRAAVPALMALGSGSGAVEGASSTLAGDTCILLVNTLGGKRMRMQNVPLEEDAVGVQDHVAAVETDSPGRQVADDAHDRQGSHHLE